MKAVLIGPASPLRGGIANFNESLELAFIKKGIDAEIVSFYFQYPSFLFPGKTQKADGKLDSRLKIKSLISSINPYSWIKTALYIKKLQPDIVIVQYWLPLMAPALGSILKLIGKKNRPKIISIVHNAQPHEKRPGDKLFTRYFARQCDGFICLSKSVLEDLSMFTGSIHKIFVPHPVYDIFGEKVSKVEAREKLGIAKDEKVILFFGIIRRYKGLELLLNSMAQDEVRKQNIKLLIAGEFYEDKQPYLSQIEALNLGNQVIIVDKFISTEEVKYYFCAADLVAQPYLNATQSGVTQIAYNFERPMLVTNVGGLAEIVPDKKVGYVTEIDSKSIATAINDFYENNREADMSKQVAIEKLRFSWNSMVDSIIHLAENLK